MERSFWRVGRGDMRELKGDVLGRHLSTGNQIFSRLICIDTTKFVLLSFITLLKPFCPKIWAKTLPKNVKSPLLVNVRRSKKILV